MHDKFSQRIDAALQRLAKRIARAKKPIDPARVNRQIGRLLQRNQRAAARFAIALEPDSGAAGFRLVADADQAALLDRLGIMLPPKRMRLDDSELPLFARIA